MEQADIFHFGRAAWCLTNEDIRRCFASFESEPGLRLRGDHDLNPGLTLAVSYRDAAVLVPLVDQADGMIRVLFTLRTANLHAHAGQISFPGGRLESFDSGPEAAALRETEEEIGLDRRHIEVIGRLDTYLTRTGFRVTPVVGLVEPGFTLQPDPTEVAEVFEVPLAFLLEPDSLRRHSRELMGEQRQYYAFPYQQRYIWGATAGMLVNLREVLQPLPRC